MNAIWISFRHNFTNFMLSIVACGFFVLLIRLMVALHFSGVQLVAIFSTLLGLLFAIHGIVQPPARRVLGVGLLILGLLGFLGTYEHYAAHKTRVALFDLQQQLANTKTTSTKPSGPPPFAPLYLSSLALFATVVMLSADDRSKETNRFAKPVLASPTLHK